MAYDTQELYEKAIKHIKDHGLYFASDVYAYLGISTSTYYDHFPEDSKESKHIKKLLEENKVATKVSIRRRLHNSDSPAGLIALYKLLASKEEHSRLTRSEIDHTTNDKPINIAPIAWVESEASTADEDDSDQ